VFPSALLARSAPRASLLDFGFCPALIDAKHLRVVIVNARTARPRLHASTRRPTLNAASCTGAVDAAAFVLVRRV
jgi:hypothetical protein